MKALLPFFVLLFALSIIGQDAKLGFVIVQAVAGDTVAKLATRNNADPTEVAKYNGLLPNSVLGPGREIKIPKTEAVLPSSPLGDLADSQLISIDELAERARRKTEITSTYDKFKDDTTVTVPDLLLTAQGKYAILHDNIKFNARFYFSGQVKRTPATSVILVFESEAPDWRFLKSNNVLIFLVDQKRVSVPLGKRSGDVSTSSVKGVICYERLIYEIPLASLRSIALSKSAELQIGSFEATLSDSDKSLILKLLAEAAK